MALEATVLVSLGRHAVSHRPRLPELEARAFGLVRAGAAAVTALHAGSAELAEAPLRACLGMGARQLWLLDIPPENDPLPSLAARLSATRPGLILAGEKAETGEGSGMVPFWLAEKLGCALVTRAVKLQECGKRVRVLQSLPGGRRRVLEAALPLVLTVDRTAPAPPLSATAPALRGVVLREAGGSEAVDERQGWISHPSRKRPRRLARPAGGGPGDVAARQVLIGPDPETAADTILDFLEHEALFAPATQSSAAAEPLPRTP